jgi:hypothetical protein
MHRIQNLSTDLQQKILSYTYSTQPRSLLCDIRDYNHSLGDVGEYYFMKYIVDAEEEPYEDSDLHWLLDDIFEYVTNNIFKIDYYDFWRRLFVFRNKTEQHINNYVMTTFHEKNIETQIKIMWGLLTPEERADVIYFGIELIDSDSNFEEDMQDDFDY